MRDLHGICTITLTPFTDEGDLDLEGIDSLTGYYLGSGVHGLTILGIMGEAHKLSDAERRAVTESIPLGGRRPRTGRRGLLGDGDEGGDRAGP